LRKLERMWQLQPNSKLGVCFTPKQRWIAAPQDELTDWGWGMWHVAVVVALDVAAAPRSCLLKALKSTITTAAA